MFQILHTSVTKRVCLGDSAEISSIVTISGAIRGFQSLVACLVLPHSPEEVLQYSQGLTPRLVAMGKESLWSSRCRVRCIWCWCYWEDIKCLKGWPLGP